MHSCNLSLFILSHIGRNIFIQNDHDSYYKKFTLEFGCSGFGKKRIEILQFITRTKWNGIHEKNEVIRFKSEPINCSNDGIYFRLHLSHKSVSSNEIISWKITCETVSVIQLYECTK